MFLINRQRRIVWTYVGQDAGDRPSMNAVLQQIAALK
jgi:hypothetical protein